MYGDPQALALLIGVLYWDQRMDQVGVFNINGALLLIISNMTFQNCTITVTVRENTLHDYMLRQISNVSLAVTLIFLLC